MAEFDGAWKLPLTELTLPHDEVHVFSVQESCILRNLPPKKRDEQFLLYWTRKEAYLKACGDGLTGLESMRTQSYNSLVPTSWFIQHLTPTPGYVAALAVQDQLTIRIAPPRLVYWQWVSPEK